MDAGDSELSINPYDMVCDYTCFSPSCSEWNHIDFVDINSKKTSYANLKTYLESINDIHEYESEIGVKRNANVPLKVKCGRCNVPNEIIVSVKFRLERLFKRRSNTAKRARTVVPVTIEAVHGITEEDKDVSLRSCFLPLTEPHRNRKGSALVIVGEAKL